MTNEEKELFSVFMTNEIFDENAKYIVEMENNDIFLIEYYGEGESEINPLTQEDDYFYAVDFLILEVIENKTKIYKKNSIIEISKYIFPIKIKKICL